MNILVIRGYSSENSFKQTIDINNKKIDLTVVHIGKPILVRKRLKQILSEHNFDNYDYIYVVSMSSCITSIIEERHFSKLCMITPFFLHSRSVRILLKSTPKDFFGCHILMLLNGFMGKFDPRIRVMLAELDNITDNKYFEKGFENIQIIKGLGHCLGEDGLLNIIREDLLEKAA